jgi:hypothetical protein
MNVTFVELPEFTRLARAAKLTDRELRALEAALRIDPHSGDLIEGTGGIRKLRFALEHTGKSSGGRAIYYYVGRSSRVYLIAVYKKSLSEDISHGAKRQLRTLAKLLDEEG